MMVGPSSPQEVVQQAVEPISTALRRLSRDVELENREDEDCENGSV
eukprot:COSAG03_NODE_15717_length_422_cov_0.959752_1_plen_45_part_10